MIYITGFVVNIFALFLLLMAFLCFLRPALVRNFFDLFAATKQAHFIEQMIRLVVGLSLIRFAEMMKYSGLFYAFGWLIVVTSLLLIVLPWRWHQKFAQRVIPVVKKHLKVYGMLSLFLAVMLLYGVWAPDNLLN
ncbi:MAG: hypothetical protein DWP95_06680 [Proteobacteria bacterium]|nr:MAG: hypothetical protein DWP95_06680 [Pseudomonadota bacterium]